MRKFLLVCQGMFLAVALLMSFWWVAVTSPEFLTLIVASAAVWLLWDYKHEHRFANLLQGEPLAKAIRFTDRKWRWLFGWAAGCLALGAWLISLLSIAFLVAYPERDLAQLIPATTIVALFWSILSLTFLLDPSEEDRSKKEASEDKDN